MKALLEYVLSHPELAAILRFYALNLIFSILLAVVLVLLLPEKYRRARIPAVLFLTVLCLGVTIVGYVGTAFLVLYLVRRRPQADDLPVKTVSLDENGSFPLVSRTFGEGSVNLFIRDGKKPQPLRLKAIESLATTRSRDGVRLVQESLADSDDDVRLFGFSIISRLGETINTRIRTRLAELEKTSDRKQKAALHRELARLHWEIIYMGLADRDLAIYLAREADNHADLAAGMSADDPSFLVLRGRIALFRNDDARAAGYFRAAVSAGIPEIRVIPYLAAIYFKQRDFRTVRDLLLRYPDFKMNPLLHPVIALWES